MIDITEQSQDEGVPKSGGREESSNQVCASRHPCASRAGFGKTPQLPSFGTPLVWVQRSIGHLMPAHILPDSLRRAAEVYGQSTN